MSPTLKHFITLPPHPGVAFDEDQFLTLLEGSKSLSLEEKQGIAAQVNKMDSGQIRELMNVFEDEAAQYKMLQSERPEVISALYGQQEKESLRSEIELGQIAPPKDS